MIKEIYESKQIQGVVTMTLKKADGTVKVKTVKEK